MQLTSKQILIMSLEIEYQKGRDYWLDESGVINMARFNYWCRKISLELLEYTFTVLYDKGNLTYCCVVQHNITKRKDVVNAEIVSTKKLCKLFDNQLN